MLPDNAPAGSQTRTSPTPVYHYTTEAPGWAKQGPIPPVKPPVATSNPQRFCVGDPP